MSIADTLPPDVRSRLEKIGKEPQKETEEEVVVSNEVETVDEKPVDNDNDINAWRGRLAKAEEERERLRISAENGAFAAQRLLELSEERKAERAEREEERRIAAENAAELAALREKTVQNQSFVSDEDAEELRSSLGDDVANQVIRTTNAAVLKAMGNTKPVDFEKVVDERVNARFGDIERKSAQTIWMQSVASTIPEIQGLLAPNSDFVQWATEKKDFSGASAMDLVLTAGEKLDVSKIPAIRMVLDEYLSTKNGEGHKVIASARPTGVAISPKQASNGKRKMTAADIAEKSRIARTGTKQELLKFLSKFEE